MIGRVDAPCLALSSGWGPCTCERNLVCRWCYEAGCEHDCVQPERQGNARALAAALKDVRAGRHLLRGS